MPNYRLEPQEDWQALHGMTVRLKVNPDDIVAVNTKTGKSFVLATAIHPRVRKAKTTAPSNGTGESPPVPADDESVAAEKVIPEWRPYHEVTEDPQ